MDAQDVDGLALHVGQVALHDLGQGRRVGVAHLEGEVVVAAGALQLVGDVDLVAVAHVEEVDPQLGGAQVDGALLLRRRGALGALEAGQQPAETHHAQLQIGASESPPFHPSATFPP